jgi:3-deoxy-D-manno-octulosonic-acid transferase
MRFRLTKFWIARKPLKTMTPWYAAYTSIGSVVFISSLPFLWAYSRLNRRFTRGWKERLGFMPKALTGLEGPIWFHASSLGEVKVADSIMSHLAKLAPGSRMILSVNTDYAFDSARNMVRKTPVVYAPFDFMFSVRKALSIVRPRIMVFLETEIWPAWIVEARKKGIQCGLINGRISTRSIGRYRKVAPFFREILKSMDVFSMISEEDRRRIVAMGADPVKVEINGNAKHDLLAQQADPSVIPEIRRIFNLNSSDMVFVAGSTREGEEEKVIEVYLRLREEFPGMILIIAPRHIGRTPAVESLLKRRNLPCQLRSRLKEGSGKRTAPVLVLDTFGELFRIYSVATITFCGASLVPLGGQNPMEPAAWGKAVFYGPHMSDFMDAKALLEKSGGGIPVEDVADFSEKALALLYQPERLASLGQWARRAVLENQGAAERHARVIARMVQKSAPWGQPRYPWT